MAPMQVNLGQMVVSSDGRKIGRVDRLVVNSENRNVENLVVDKGFLSGDTLIDIDLVERAEPDGVRLSITAAEADDLPGFVTTRFVEAPADAWTDPMLATPSAYGGGRIFYPTAGGVGAVGGIFEAAPIPAPVIENESNIPVQDVVIGEGTDVVGVDGKKVGSVDRVLFAKDGGLDGFVVKAGFFLKHDVRVPIGWVADVGQDEIRLNVSGDEVAQ